MTITAIQDLADVVRLEQQPYDEYLPHTSVLAALEHAALTHGERLALTYVHTPDPQVEPVSWTYQAFIGKVRQAANLFRKLSGADSPRVATLLPNIPQAWFTMFGAETAGLLCPVNYQLDANHTAELIAATGANILVILGPHPDLDIWSRLDTVRANCPALQHVLVVGSDATTGELDFDASLEAMPAGQLTFNPSTDRQTVAALFHTGGTTGRPKLAQHTHGNQLHVSIGAAQMYGMSSKDVMINGFPLFHVAGSFVCGLSVLMVGAELVIPTLLGMRSKGYMDRYWDFVEKHGITFLTGVPAVLSTLTGTSPSAGQTQGVRAMLTGGTPLPDDLADNFAHKFGVPVRNIFGMTECAGVISIEPVAGERVRGSCGLRLPYTQVRAVDAADAPLDTGCTGVLQVSGPNVGPGYTEAPRNAGTFDEGWLTTGDIGHVDASGFVHITGRAKDLIVRSSHNIDPRLIEDALMRHPAVLMAAAVGEPDEYAGELPVAYVVLKPGAMADAKALVDFAAQHIPERPAFPKRVEIVEALPLTAVGKVFKPALRHAAIRFALSDRLAKAGLQNHAAIDVREEDSATVVVFCHSPGVPPEQLEPALRSMMASFALRWRLASPNGEGQP